ncbi:MAG: enoyl-CoA hydratase-related protein [Desulfobacterales bacterium]
MSYKQIEYEKKERIAIIRANRPRYRNAQSRILLEEMDSAFIDAEQDPGIHVVILQGAGEHFSAGHDLGTPEELEDAKKRPYTADTLGHIQRTWDLFVDASLRWRDLKKPTIAQVQGYCIFGGYLIASCMDLIIASEDALFLPSHLQLFTAPWDLGIRKAKAILFENRFIPAQEAYELGLVHKVVPREDLESETWAQAERIAENDLLALRMLKQSINGAQDAMGYRTSVHTAHSNYMVLISGRPLRDKDERRLAGVGAALRKLQDTPDNDQ